MSNLNGALSFYKNRYNIITEQSLKRNAFGDLGNECMAH